LFICEGPTDTAALLSLGLFAIGRASCRGGIPIIQAIVDQLALEVVIVCDNDSPGLAGADLLMKSIRKPVVKLIPPTKDIRFFVQKGASKALIDSMLKDMIWKH
jgi:5S rRNA maturation endonuclease (ribonuclease M5)